MLKLPSRRRVRIALLGLLAVPALSLILAVPAFASGNNQTPTSSVSSNGIQTGLICGSTPSTSSTSANNLLPINRWSGALGNEHVRLPGGFLSGISNAPSSIDRSVFVGGMTSIGAAEWQLGSSAVQGASQFCFASTVGLTANRMAGNLGHAILNSPILAILAVLTIGIAAWRAMRGREKSMRHFLKFAIVGGALIMLVAAATASTATYNAPGSPAWLLTNVYNAISNVSSAPANAISAVATNTIGNTSQQTIAKSDPLSCYWYNQELINQYQQAFKKSGSAAYIVPTSMNSIWELSAIDSYSNEQFGASNNYGPPIYCHLLEDQTGIQPSAQMAIAKASGSLSGDSNLHSFGVTQASALAWNGALTNDQTDESMVAWAACQSPAHGSRGSGFTPSEWDGSTGAPVSAAFTTVPSPTSNTTVSGPDCQTFWSANAPATGGQFGDATGPFANPSSAPWTGQILNPDKGVFNWTDDPTAIASATNATAAGAGIANFLGNLHGTQNSGAEASAFFFLLSSTVILAIFGVIALAIIIAKLSLIMWMILLPLMLLFGMLPSASGKFITYVRHMFGLILFSTGAGLILSFIAIVTSVLSSMGSAAFGVGSLFSQIFITIAPVAAVVMVQVFFKKVLKAPSPFSVKGSMSYAGALGGFGAGVAGADVFSHMRKHGMRAASAAGGRITSGAKATMNARRGTGPTNSRPGRPGQPTGTAGGQKVPAGTQLATPGVGTPGTSTPGAPTPIEGAVSPSTTDPQTGLAAPIEAGAAAAGAAKTTSRRRPRPWETDQAQANRYARQQKQSQVKLKAEMLKGSLLKPAETRQKVSDATLGRVQKSLETAKGRYNFGARGGPQWVKGTLGNVGAVATATAHGVRRAAPKVAKYGAVGVLGAGAIGLGAPVVAAAAGVYGVHKLRQRFMAAPARASERLTNYQQHLDDEAATKLAQEQAATEREKEQERLRLELEQADEEKRTQIQGAMDAARIENRIREEAAREAQRQQEARNRAWRVGDKKVLFGERAESSSKFNLDWDTPGRRV